MPSGPAPTGADPPLDATQQRRLRRDLAVATRAGAFQIVYQPRVAVAGLAHRGVEALVRWPNGRRGLIPAGAFLPLAEATGHIVAIGGWSLMAACRDAAGWRDHLTVSVNIAARQLSDRALLGQVATALGESGLPPERLELELHEAALADPDLDTLLTLAALRDLGLGLALDDFGAAHGSLIALRRLPLTAVKLSRALVRDLATEPDSAAIVRAVVAVAHALDLVVVADGVETAAQQVALTAAGCDAMQGYLIGRPRPAGDFARR